jgi:hypothetical protein
MRRISDYVLRITCYVNPSPQSEAGTLTLRFIAGYCLPA